MKKIFNNTMWFFLAVAISANVFAENNPKNNSKLAFDVSSTEPDAKSPFFYCIVIDNASIPLGFFATTVRMEIEGRALAFPNNIREYSNISLDDIRTKYFQVIKGEEKGAGIVSVTASNNSEITCYKGKGEKKMLYTQ